LTAPQVALTFDDGPADWTGAVLDLLREHGALGTFFVVGSLALAGADLIRRMAAEGHEVGNHSWSHARLAERCDDVQVHDELKRTNDVLVEILGAPPRRFRAPQYNVDARVESIASQLGLVHTRGDIRPPDWDERCSASFITLLVVQQVKPGSIVGLHDGVPPHKVGTTATRQPTVDALAAILPRLADRGFDFVTASTLLDGSNGA
jgi:peptidoglycan-N-acetylglucosamine deacetylase